MIYKNILIYNSGGGLGDAIQLFPLILSLKDYYKKTNFYYLGAHENHFEGKLKDYGIKITTLNLGIKYFGFRWWHFFVAKKRFLNKNYQKIDLIIDLQSKLRNTLILKSIPHVNFYSTTFYNKFCSKKVKLASKNHLQNLKIFLGENIKLLNFNINQIPKKILNEADKLLPNKDYIGFSITQGNKYRKKNWSIEKFISLAKQVLKKNKIPVFFIEKGKIDLINKIKEQIPTALFPEVETTLSGPALVTALSSKLDQAVSIDNGVMHMIGLANIPMIVLFGPTNSKKFAPKNNYTKILDSKKIYGSKNIDSITVEEVYELI